MNKNLIQASKMLSLVLRHKPEQIGIKLDNEGWVEIETLLLALQKNSFKLTRKELEEVVTENDKKRFAISEDGTKIRASQGHSVEVELGYQSVKPPEILYHGTATQFLDAIQQSGLQKQSRQHVHLSAEEQTAKKVGQRHGKVVILIIAAAKMHLAGFKFYCSENGVWLTDEVPMEYIKIQNN